MIFTSTNPMVFQTSNFSVNFAAYFTIKVSPVVQSYSGCPILFLLLSVKQSEELKLLLVSDGNRTCAIAIASLTL